MAGKKSKVFNSQLAQKSETLGWLEKGLISGRIVKIEAESILNESLQTETKILVTFSDSEKPIKVKCFLDLFSVFAEVPEETFKSSDIDSSLSICPSCGAAVQEKDMKDCPKCYSIKLCPGCLKNGDCPSCSPEEN